ncbi:alpha/beta hydrolase [Tundrisphaera sp. TA3]|uniref:alpha/beta hydrolase n=1 Tax=Tundrisphaera sp. TA3 TaxID=3435775 RepID=UPI003EB69FC5
MMLRRALPTLVVLATVLAPATGHAQIWDFVSLRKVNGRLAGRVDDYTHNHGQDLRACSPILGMKRDLYVYVPPGYDPAVAYPLIVYFHSADFDEHALIGMGLLEELDAMILRGECPPVVVACPDGNYSGRNWVFAKHSLFVNGDGGRMEDHVMQEVIPFVQRHYSILPNREAHAVLGDSAGGYGALGMAIKHRDFFAASATLASPINLRYTNADGIYGQQFDPATYRWVERYDPETVIATFYHGLRRVKAKSVLGPIYGDGPDALARMARDNPADLLFGSGLRPGELAIYLRFGALDEYNFDSHNLSFAWLASGLGIDVEVACDPEGRHNLPFFKAHHQDAFRWLAARLPPPSAR